MQWDCRENEVAPVTFSNYLFPGTSSSHNCIKFYSVQI
jgi:hypothetical protein